MSDPMINQKRHVFDAHWQCAFVEQVVKPIGEMTKSSAAGDLQHPALICFQSSHKTIYTL